MPNNAAQRIPHIFLALLLALAWAAPPVQAATVVVANPGEPPTLDANMTFNGFSFLVTNQILETLVYKDEAGFQPRLATAWEAVDERTWRLKLREGVTFHDGTPFDAHAVKFTIERILDPANRAQGRFVVSMIEEVRVIDAHTVELVTSSPFAPLLAHLTHPMTAIVSPAAVERLGEDFGRHPVGTGPFVFESWQAGDQVILRRNEHYWGGAPAIETVIIRTIPEPATQVVELRSGAVDFIFNVSPDHMNDLSSRPGIAVRKELGWGSTLLGFNVTQGPLADVRVRRAIAHAIDREAIVQYVYAGVGEVLNSLVPKGFWAHTEEGLPVYDYDPDKARQLLQEAGWGNGFRVTLDTFESTNYLPVALAVQDMLGQVGIDVHIEITDITTWLEKVSSAQTDFTLYLPTRSPDPDIVLTQFYHSSSFSPGLNLPRYSALDAEIEAARSELDDERRMAMYHQIQRRLMEDLPSIPIAMVDYVSAYDPALKGIPELEPVWGFDFTKLWFEE